MKIAENVYIKLISIKGQDFWDYS